LAKGIVEMMQMQTSHRLFEALGNKV